MNSVHHHPYAKVITSVVRIRKGKESRPQLYVGKEVKGLPLQDARNAAVLPPALCN